MIGALGALRAEVAESNAAIDRAGLVTLSFGNVSGVDWNQYTTALRKAAARTSEVATAAADATAPKPVETKLRRAKAKASEPTTASGDGTTD